MSYTEIVFGYMLVGLAAIASVSEFRERKLYKWQAILIFLFWPLGLPLVLLNIIRLVLKDHVE